MSIVTRYRKQCGIEPPSVVKQINQPLQPYVVMGDVCFKSFRRMLARMVYRGSIEAQTTSVGEEKVKGSYSKNERSFVQSKAQSSEGVKNAFANLVTLIKRTQVSPRAQFP